MLIIGGSRKFYKSNFAKKILFLYSYNNKENNNNKEMQKRRENILSKNKNK